jgi:hypothetical protein
VGAGDKPPPKAGQIVDFRGNLLSQRVAFKTKFPCKSEKQTANCTQTWTAEGWVVETTLLKKVI